MAGWIKYGRSFREFRVDNLAEPGVQVRVRERNVRERNVRERKGRERNVRERKGRAETYLLGDVNCLGGGCDDCPSVSYDSVVDAYRVLLTPADLESDR